MKKCFRFIWFEWKVFFRESRYWIPFFIPPVLFSLTFFIEARLSQGMFDRFAIFLGSMSLSLGADRISLERERKMLELTAMLPLSRRLIFWSKTLSVILIPLIFWGITVFAFVMWYGSSVLSSLAHATQWLGWTLLGLSVILWLSVKAKLASQLGILFFLSSVFGQGIADLTNWPIGVIGCVIFAMILIVYEDRTLWWKAKA